MNNKTKLFSLIFHNEGIHIRELSRLSKTGLPTVDHHLKNMEKEKMIKKVTEGRNVKLYVNYAEITIIPALYSSEYERLMNISDRARYAIFDYLRSLESKPIISILFGSYAKGTANSKSDIDILLIYDKPKRGDIENKATAVKYRHNIEISPVYMTFPEFKEKFFNEKDRFMKEIKKDNILIQGIEWWVMLENEK